MDYDDLQDKLRDAQDQRNEVIAKRTFQSAIANVESDYYGAEIVSETVPYHKERWQIFRDEIVKHMEGSHADYAMVGLIFIKEAEKYALECSKSEVLDDL